MESKRNYEVSIWSLQDEFITVLKPLDVENIGQLENKELQLKTDDGVNQYSCSIPMYIYKGTERIENPIWYNTLNGNIVSNMRKIKIIVNKGAEDEYHNPIEQVYEFLIIKVEERHDKDQLYCDITCEDLAFHELGKQGYKISLSSDVYLDKHSKWADEDGDPENEPLNNLQYWLDQFLEPLPENPVTTQWYYEVRMNWDAYADGDKRDTDKVYEEEYTSSWSLNEAENKVLPAAIEKYKEKMRLVDLEESNIFNLTQDLAETFEVFVKYEYLYDDNYHIRGRRIIFYNNYIREEEGYIDITYPYNASQITRTIDATDVTTKMFIRPVTEDTTESGMLTIMGVDANKTREDYLLNFDYMRAVGAITDEQYAEIPMYEARMRACNLRLENLKSYLAVLEDERSKLDASKTLTETSIQLDQERIQEANDLLNSLDLKDTDADGSITRDSNNPAGAILIPQPDSNGKYYINISTPGVHRDTLHIYTIYNYTGSNAGIDTNSEITGTFVDDEFGNLIQVKDLPGTGTPSSQVYLTYKYTPRLKYEQVSLIWTVRLGNDQAKLTQLESDIAENESEHITTEEEYNRILDLKQEWVEGFNRMMGPALRESYWQPEDYKVNGDVFEDTFAGIDFSNATITGASGHAEFLWDTEPFEEEQLASYKASVVEEEIYYPCVDLSDHWEYIVENYNKISFMFYDYIAPENEPYQFKYFRHYTLGSQAQLGFAKVGNTIKPIMILTGAESHSLYTLRNMINAKVNNQDGPLVGIYSVSYENGVMREKIDDEAFKATWLNLKNNGTISGYNITTVAGFEAWATQQFEQEDNNIKIIALAEQQVWDEVEIVYPRIKIDSMLLKNDETLSLHINNKLLTQYDDYYLLTRQVNIEADPAATPIYKGMYFLTIKPQVMGCPAAATDLSKLTPVTHNDWAITFDNEFLEPNTTYTFTINGNTAYKYALYLGNSGGATELLAEAIGAGERITFTTPATIDVPYLNLSGEEGAGNENLNSILPRLTTYTHSNLTLKFYYTLSNAETAIYLDAIQVLKENAYPKVTYTISPTLIHRDFHYRLHELLNRIVNINDIDLKFDNVQGYISGLTINLDNPFNDKIEIKNYRNKFEDLFSSIVAQTESMKKNAYTIGLAAAAFTATGALSPAVIQQSINNIDLDYAFNQGTLTIDEENGIWATSDDGVVAMRGGGIFTATEKDDDGNWQWNTGILPSGINASLITTGQLDTNLIRVYAGDKLRFQLNGDGLFAYKSIFDDPQLLNLLAQAEIGGSELGQKAINKLQTQTGLDYLQYVVHNENGLFLVAKEDAIVKTNTGLREITSETGDINRVEISWDGLKLRNWDNKEVFYASADTGDLTLEGTLLANDIVILHDVTLGTSDDAQLRLAGDNIVIDTNNFKLNADGEGTAWINGAIQATSLSIGENAATTLNTFINNNSNVSRATGFVDRNEIILQTMEFNPNNGLGLVVRIPGEGDDYWTSTRNTGYYIMYGDTEVASFTGTRTTVRQLRIGDIVVKPTSHRGWKWVDALEE